MANYLNKEGILYTQEEIESAAQENGVDIDTIIADNELTLGEDENNTELPGKKKRVTAKKPTVTQSKLKTKSASPTKTTSSDSNGKVYPWQSKDVAVNPSSTDKFKKQAAKEKGQGVPTVKNINKSNKTTENFIANNPFDLQNGSLMTGEAGTRDFLNLLPEEEEKKFKEAQAAADRNALNRSEKEAISFINSKVNVKEAQDQLDSEINDSEFSDYLREGAKSWYNEAIGGPISMVGQSLGANIDLTISPKKPLAEEKKQAISELSKNRKAGTKITNQEIDNRAKEIFLENKIVDQKGKAAEEYFDNLDDPKLQEKLKIKAIGDKLNSSSVAKQRTLLAKTLNTQLDDFSTYASSFKSRYDLGEVTNEEIAEYKSKAADATDAYKQLNYIYNDFPSVLDKLDSDTAKLDYFKYNYDDVEGNLMRLYGTTEKIVGGTAKFAGELVSYFEEGATDTKLGELISATGGDILSDSEKRAKEYKNISFDSVNSFSDFGKYAGILFSEQVPIYASMFFGGEAGAYGVAASSGGQKIQEMEDEIGANYDRGTKLLTAFAFAAAEFIPEKIGTLRMFENMKGTMMAVNQESRQLFKQNFIDASLKYVGKTGAESFIEGSTETLTEFLDFTIDEQFLGKKISSEEKVKRTKNAFIGGAIMAGGMQGLGGASTLVAKELKNYATNNELATSKKIMDRIDFLQNEIQSNMGLTSKETSQIKSEIDKLTDDSISIIENSKDRVYDMTSKDMVAVLDINRKQQDIKQSYAELIESNFSDVIKQEKASELKDEFNKLERDRNFLLTGKYAAANRIIGNGIAIDSSIENIRKLANSLGEKEVANKIGGQSGVAVFEDQSELKQAYKQWLVTENKSVADEANKLTSEEIDNKVEEAGNSDGFILPNGQLVINKTIAAQTGAINVANHEFLHKVLRSAFSNPVELKKTVDSFISTLSEKEKSIVQKRIDDNYRYTIDESGNKVENNFNDYAEEYFTAFIDAIAKGDIKWDSNLKESLIRIANPIVKLLQRLGFTNIKFNEGRDFYNFLKDYQTNISKGRITTRANSLLKGEPVNKVTAFSKSIEEKMDILDEQLSSGEIDIDQYEAKMTALEKEESQLKRAEYEQKKEESKAEVKTEAVRTKKEKTELSDIAAKAKAKLDAIGNDTKGFNSSNPAIYAELDKMVKAKSRNWRTSNGTVIDFTNKDKGGLDGFDLDEMASYVRTSMIPYIAKFDPAKNNSLYGYINAQYANRMRAALKSGEVANVVFTEDVSEMKGLSNEEVETTKPSLPERKRFQNILESGVFSPDVIDNISAKVLPIVRTLKSKINEKISINKTTAPIIAEIKDEMGKQADIDIKKAMGGKENQELQNWLITNKKTILENMTTTWLMGKDGKGGMPFAIQKRIGGRWVNFPEWVGKKIDRESVSTDLAGRTAGHEMVRRLPDVDKNVSTMEFLSSIIDLKDSSPIRGRKEALAKALAEEISFDLISDDISNDGPIASALQKNQELLGAVTERILAEEFNRLSERGNVKFSISQKQIDDAINYLVNEAGGSIYIARRSGANAFNDLYEIVKAGGEETALNDILDRYQDVLEKIAYNKHETNMTILLKTILGNEFSGKKLGGNNNNVADFIITKGKVADKNNPAVANVELKKNAFARITSGTINSISGKDLTATSKDSFDKISKAYNDFLKGETFSAIRKLTEGQTKTGNFRVPAENKIAITNILKGKRVVFAEPIPLNIINDINLSKKYSNDLLVLGTTVSDYFGAGFKDKYGIEEDNIVVPQIEMKLVKNGENYILYPRVYFYLDKATAVKMTKTIIEGNNLSEISKMAGIVIDNKAVLANAKSQFNNLNSFSKPVENIDIISDYISKNNAKRIDAETSFDILNDTLKDIENYWGILPNEVIASMERTVDYAFDVIEDRENDGGPLMAAVNDALNVETLKNTEKQLNTFIDKNYKNPEGTDTAKFSKSSGNYTTVYAGAPKGKDLKVIGRKGVNFFATDLREAKEYARMNDGDVQDFVISNNDIVDEEIAIAKMKELGFNPADSDFTIDESSFYELIDPRFENSLDTKDITKLFDNLRENGIKAIRYSDGAQVSGNTTNSIAVIDPSVLLNKKNTKFSKSLSYDFNDMLERNTGVASYEKVSDIVAKRTGVKANKLSFFIPPSAEDFRGLTTYMFSGKGKEGEADQQFFDENLVVPYVKGINTLDSVRQSIKKEYKKLLNDFPTVKNKLEKLTPDKQFTYDQAVRVYLWNKSNIEIPGIDRKTKNKLVYFVKTDSDLLKFAESLSLAARQSGKWMDPSTTWDSETIISDLHNITEGSGRKAWLSEFIENADSIFSPENLNKVQSIYGTNVRIALEDSLYRMKNGKSRPEGTDNLTNKWMNWINGSTAAIMFFNTRSALLQTISAINYLNWTDNNVWTSAKAFANQKQYWSDFAMIINSDKMKERRSGLKADVTQAEIANAANSTKSKALGVLSYLQKIGFTPTQAADSFSIAIGGAAFYRNRVKTYQSEYTGLDADGNLKRKYTDKEAEDKAWVDFSNITDQSMQSADPLYVSKQQTTSLGRLVLAFGNTPMQYNRLIKKAALDIANKRGNFGTNISKIIYYGALQNFIFSALQAALFLPFEDEKDEEELAAMSKEDRKAYEKLIKKQNDKTIGIANGMVDTVLRGSGITGALISTIKNTIIEYNKQEEREMFADHAQTLLTASGISPSISSKARKVYGIIRMNKFEKDVIAERGWEVTRDGRLNLSPNYNIAGNAVVATTNIPLDRLVEKVNNVAEALDSRNNKIQRIALSLGWKPWELNVKNEESEQIKAKAKEVRKKEGVEKSIQTRADKKEAEEAAYKAMSPQEKMVYRRQKSEKQLQKRKEKAQRKLQEIRKKRKMGE